MFEWKIDGLWALGRQSRRRERGQRRALGQQPVKFSPARGLPANAGGNARPRDGRHAEFVSISNHVVGRRARR
jgi:hypothetical protein